MSEPDVSLIARIALEEHEGPLILDTLQAVCQRSYPEQAESLFRDLVERMQERMTAGGGPEAALRAIADELEPAAAPQPRPWWAIWR